MSSSHQKRHHPNWRAVFGVPILIGVISLAGLLMALLFASPGRYFSWPAVGLPVFVVLWFAFRNYIRS